MFTEIRSGAIPLNRNEFLGLPGMVTLNDSDNDGFGRIQTSDALRVSTQDAADSGKRFLLRNSVGYTHHFFPNTYK